MKIHKEDREKLVSEISKCQERITQILGPTIFALGVLGVSDIEKQMEMTMTCMFSVLFLSGMFILTLSYKIYRNASFIKVFSTKNNKEVYWENMLAEFRKEEKLPPIIHAEATTIGVVYLVMSVVFFMLFKRHFIFASFFTCLLLIIPISMFCIYAKSKHYDSIWKKIKSDIKAVNR